MSLRVQVARGLKWQAITIGGRQVLSLVVFTTLARLLDPSAFGLLGLVSVYLVFVGMFVDQGIGTAIIQRQDLQPEHLDSAFWFNIGCAAILCAATIVFAGPISTLLGSELLAPLLRWASLGLVIGAIQEIHATLFTKSLDFRRTAIRTLLANCVGGAVGVGMAATGYGVWALIGQQLSSAIAGACFLWSVSPYRPSFKLSWRHLRELLGISLSIFTTSFIWFFTSRLDQIVIGRFIGLSALGLYAVAGKIPEFAKMVTQQPLSEVSLPALSSIQNDKRRLNDAVYRGMEMNAVISFAIFVGVASVAADLVPFLFGVKWTDAATVCSLLSFYALVTGLQIFTRPLFLAIGEMRPWVVRNAAQAIGVCLACVVGVRFGVSWLVTGLIVNNLLIGLNTLFFFRRRAGLSIGSYCRPCLVPGLASLSMLVAIFVLRTFLLSHWSQMWRLFVEILLGAIIYIAIIISLSPGMAKRLREMASHAVSI